MGQTIDSANQIYGGPGTVLGPPGDSENATRTVVGTRTVSDPQPSGTQVVPALPNASGILPLANSPLAGLSPSVPGTAGSAQPAAAGGAAGFLAAPAANITLLTQQPGPASVVAAVGSTVDSGLPSPVGNQGVQDTQNQFRAVVGIRVPTS